MTSARRTSLSPTVLAVFLLALAVYAAYVLYASAASRGFFADGSFFYVAIVSSRDQFNYFDDSRHIRLLVNIANQLPLIALTKIGTFEPVVLRFAFNFPLFAGNAILLAMLALSAKRHGTFVIWGYAVLAHIATVMPSDIFALNQARLAQPIYWAILFFATAPQPLLWKEKIFLAALVIVSFRSHEGIIVFGPLITIAALWGARYISTDRRLRLSLAATGVALTLFGIYWQLSHPVADATAGFLANASYWTVRDVTRSTMTFGWLLMVALLAQLLITQLWPKSPPRATLGLLIPYVICCFLLAYRPIRSVDALSPGLEFSTRILIPFGGAALAVLALADMHKGWTRKMDRNTVVLTVSIALLCQSIWHIVSTQEWNRLVLRSQEVLAQAQSPVISYQEVTRGLSEKEKGRLLKYSWGWTWPSFSIAISDERDIKAVMTPEHHQQHFFVSRSEPEALHVPFKYIWPGYFNINRITSTCQAQPHEWCKP